VHCSDSVKTCGAINPIKQLLPKRLPWPMCQNQHCAFNCQASAHCIQDCLVVSLSPKQYFYVYFMALDKELTHATMLNSFAQDVLNSSEKNGAPVGYCTPTWNFSFIFMTTTFLKHCAQYTSQFKMWNYAMRSAADNALFQLRYLFGFTLSVFSHQQDSFGECPNWMMHNKHHWDYKSFVTP